ncbi:MAG: hypothetical protein FJ144_00825 [Deltaproteobacteria bacterium]|nr:hypothetical protein [Deltaproteobacteria bacterium]
MSSADAERRIGESVTVDALVEGVICSPRACLLSLGSGWSGLVATIAAADVAGFPPPKETYEGRRVHIRGVVVEREGRPRIELTDRSRIEIVPEAAPASASGKTRSRVVSTRRSEGGAAGGTSAPTVGEEASAPQAAPPPRTETRVQVSGGLQGDASRVDEIVRELREEAGEPSPLEEPGASGSQATVSGLRDRVSKQSQTIESLEGEVAALEERLAELESQPPPAPPPPPGSMEGVPQMEPYVVPARSGLRERRVRTGWSTQRLVREFGTPRQVEPLPGGGSVWYYDGGRAVTVGERGRVVSATGF